MAPLTFYDTHNMVAFLSKSDASAGFDQILDFLNAQVIQYALMVNPTIYVSYIKHFWATASIKKANDVVKLQALVDRKKVVVTEDVIRQDIRLDDVDGVECLSNEEIFAGLARMGYEKPPPKLTVYKAFFSAQWKFLIHTLVQCVSAKRTAMVRNVDSPSKFLMYPRFLQVLINNQVDGLSSHTTRYSSSTFTPKVFANMRRVGKGFSEVETPLFASMLVQPKDQATEEEDDVEILKLKKRIKKLEKKRRSKSFGLKRLRKVGEKIEAIDADEDITLVDMENQVDLDAKLQWRKDDDNVATKDISVAEPTVFDDEEIAKRLHDEDVEQAVAREKQEKDDLEKAKGIQQQYDDKQENIDWNVVPEQIQEKHLDNIRKCRSLKRKPVFIAQARKNMIIYLKNMVVYKMEHFRGVTYDKVKYPLIDWKIHSEGSKTYWKIIRVGGITEACQSFEDMLKEFDREDLDALWRLVKENFSSAIPTVDKEKALWVELTRLFESNADDVFWKLQRYMHDPLTWKLYTNCGVHHVSSTRRHDIFMLTEKYYHLSNDVMIMILSAKLQVEEDSDIARDLVMKIFMEANKPNGRSLDTSSKYQAG
nr:hypothetical protein [Tanacetum cinerariifolium]